jgi:hypothetical protein
MSRSIDREFEILDVSILHAIQGNSPEIDCSETIGAVLKSRVTYRCSSEGLGPIHAYTSSAWGKHVFIWVGHIKLPMKNTSKSDGLKRDLNLWSSGLFPFFEYAATSVKVCDIPFSDDEMLIKAQPTLLNLYERHYLPLQGGLRPVMRSFILSLLPGLEEETGEFFEKVNCMTPSF